MATASDPPSLTLMARNKMHSSTGSKDSCSLHRWVLLKNSLSVCPTPLLTNPAVNNVSDMNPVYSDSGFYQNDEPATGEADSFLFPDAGKLVSNSHSCGSEAQWLDTLLKALADDDDDDDELVESDGNPVTVAGEDDDEDPSLSPLSSPMSSSDNLHQHSCYTPSLDAVSYSVPYQHYQPPLLRPFQELQSPISSLPAPYEDPLPYHNLDGVQELSVISDAIIEDISDDESDTPSTPSFGRSSASLTLSDVPSTSPPTERSRLRHTVAHIYGNKDDSFYPFEADPLPFSNDHSPYNAYREY
ncbi:hypothetical protein AX17_001946 [Amanita inopinata Kibby_2008]|nr:hypothetical protein AX17_001946 [Amanita inopinata Kibby_2008]